MQSYQPSQLPLTQVPTAPSTFTLPSSPHLSQSQEASQRSSQTFRARSPNEKPKLGGRRRQNAARAHDEDGDTATDANLNRIGKLYEKILTYGTGTRYSIYIIPVALILMIPVIVGATQVSGDAEKDPKIGGIRVVWFFTWIEAVWLTYWGMKFVARIIPLLFSYFSAIVSSSTKRYALILRNLEDIITLVGWVAISFVLYEVLFSTASAGNTPLGWTSQFKKVMGALLVATIIFGVEKVFVQIISVSYHARSFNAKIDDSKRAVYLLSLLFDASREMFPMYGDEFLEEDYVIHQNIKAMIRKGHPKQNGDQGRLLGGMGRLGNKVNSVFGNIAAELTGKSVLPPRSAQSIVTECLMHTKSSRALAHRLWFSFVVEDSDALHLSDVKEVLGPDRQDVAEECFDMLDPDGNSDVSLDEATLKITELCVDRKALARSMHDVSQAIGALDNVMSAVALLVSVFALICFLDTGFHSILSTASTSLLSLSFVFSATAAEFLGSCIFLFVKHPYDIGDRVHISGPDGINQLEVTEISLFYSTFSRITDLESIQIPNNILNTLWINNITRSKGLLSRFDLYISFDTPMTDIDSLRHELQNYITSDDNKRDFHPDMILRCLGVGNMDKLQLQLEVRHKSNWPVERIRAARQSKMMCALVLATRKVPIFGPGGGPVAPLGDPTNPAYSVTIPDEAAAAARDKALRDADSARMFPLTPRHAEENQDQAGRQNASEHLASMPERKAADALNTINLADSLIDNTQDATTTTTSTSLEGLPTTSSNLELQKSKSPQGKRRPGWAVQTRLSIESRRRQMEPPISHTRTWDHGSHVGGGMNNNTLSFDQEAQ